MSIASTIKRASRVMEHDLAYRAWQAPFAEQKFAPVRAANDMGAVRRVLDVGCGPGTNAHWFRHADYVGIDFNPEYIESARRRHGRTFIVADVTKYEVDPAERFDFILANSLFHHIDDANVRRILAHLATLLTPDGHVHVLDLVLPPRGIARTMALADRGDHPRPLEEWRRLFREPFQEVQCTPYALGVGPLALWQMVYFKGRAPR